MKCNLDTIDITTIDINDDVYLCRSYNCNKYHKSQDSIRDAIYFLNINRLKFLLNSMTRKQVIEYKIYKNNILSYILSEFMSVGQGKTTSLASVNWYLFKFNNECNKLTLELLQYICSTYPELITQNDIDGANYFNCVPVFDILTLYFIDENVNENVNENNYCFICNSSHNSQLINNICSCKNKIHLQCLIKCTKEFGDICRTCNNNIISKQDLRGRTFYPNANIFPSPLLNNYVIINDENINEQLHFSIAYLCIDKTQEILNKMTTNEFNKYVEKCDKYALHKIENNILKLIDMPYTNYSRQHYNLEFTIIEELLLNKATQIL